MATENYQLTASGSAQSSVAGDIYLVALVLVAVIVGITAGPPPPRRQPRRTSENGRAAPRAIAAADGDDVCGRDGRADRALTPSGVAGYRAPGVGA